MIFGRARNLESWMRTAFAVTLCCAAPLVGAQEFLPLPTAEGEAEGENVEQLPPVADEEEEYVPWQPAVVPPTLFPGGSGSACLGPSQDSAIREPPRLVDLWLEGVPRLLSWPNKAWGDCLSWTLHSPRVEVPTTLSDFPIDIHPVPARPPLLLECGENFLSPGPLKSGFNSPFGAVWRPALWVFGEYRTALQYTDYGPEAIGEWANRLDLFGQLNLTGTERILLGMRPVDEELSNRRRFSSIDFRDGSINGFNAEVQTLFFEGDFGEMFPELDPHDVMGLDYGFSVGRMPLLAQQGLLINEDRMDAVTVTKNTLFTKRILNLRMTGVYGWSSINRNSPDTGVPNTEDLNSRMVALLTESDFARSTVNADVVYVESDAPTGDLIAFGLSGIQRHQGYFNNYNTSLHVLASFPVNGETPFAQQGELLFAQTSWTPHHYEDLIYLNMFLAIDEFTSPARGPLAGGPLGQSGLLFTAPGIGRVGPAINVQANNAAGGSLGYQFFFDHTRQQLIWELGGQKDTDGTNRGAIATGTRYQRALGQHWIALLDATVGKRESASVGTSLRAEARVKF
jgi:hypothetical protein